MASPRPPDAHLPYELLDHIVSFIARDIPTLRTLSLSCHVLDAIAKPHLFAVVDFRVLSSTEMRPLLRYVRELRLNWKADMFNMNEDVLLDRLLLPNLTPATFPRLESLVICGIGPRGTALIGGHQEMFALLPSLTSLTLWETFHEDMHGVQTLITALPYLKTLCCRTVSWNSKTEAGSKSQRTAHSARAGPQIEALHVPATFPGKTLALLRWLAGTPTQESLRTLIIPSGAHNAPELVPLFGPSVQELTVPVRRMPSSCLERYTSLESLTLLINKYHALTARWDSLPLVLASLPAPRRLRSLTLQLELDRVRSADDVSDAVVHAIRLEEADRVLFSEMADSDSDSHPFEKLQEVQFVVRTSYSLSKERQSAFGALIQRLLRRAHACGRLIILFET